MHGCVGRRVAPRCKREKTTAGPRRDPRGHFFKASDATKDEKTCVAVTFLQSKPMNFFMIAACSRFTGVYSAASSPNEVLVRALVPRTMGRMSQQKRPEELLVDRYMPNASQEEREQACENVRRLVAVFIRINERLVRDESHDSEEGGRFDISAPSSTV